MSCPQSVPTYGFDTCGQAIMLTRDGDGTTQEHTQLMGGRSYKLANDKATISLVITDDMVMQETRNFLVDNRTFAIYTIHLGRKAWHIVRHSGAGVTFKAPHPNYWEGQLKVDVLGYTDTATPMTMPKVVVDDAGKEVTDDSGRVVVTDMVAGVATGCKEL